ncbi:hypothetical protein [Bacillus alkalicellulosilyticus]|uniref:hypothetical protein n=1 Tax=Alkalihalobacterium alkalicellulosilyticum TaxID=1912214 RepID=UPI000998AA1F|nr:hypothetical protein [Bacillus alkalicellulosilyticus]
MYRLVSFIVILSFVSTVLYFYNESRHHHSSSHEHHSSTHERIIIHDDAQPPSITGWVQQDASHSWYIKINTEHFQFTPEKTGSDDVSFNEGHAHLYINGEMMNRLYGEYYNLGYLEPGHYVVAVTLHANNHSSLVYDDKEIATTFAFEVH